MKKILLLALTMLMAVQLFAQNVTATGTVKDDKGNVLAGVSVAEDGVTNSTLTDIDGNFQLPLSSKNVIVITMKGYEKKEVVVGPDGKVPDIVMQKNIKRVNNGCKAGLDYVIPQYEMKDDIELDFEPTHSINGGFYIDINLSRTFSFEFGAQLFYKHLESKDYPIKINSTSLHIPIVCCKWRPGDKKKQFIILFGHGVELAMIKEIHGDSYYKTVFTNDNFSNIMYAVHFGVGYELKCGLGFLATAKINFSFKEENDITETYGFIGGALTYRFDKR